MEVKRIRVTLVAIFLSGVVSAASAGQLVGVTVVDGDTVRAGTEKVRMLDLDAPELNARCPEEKRLARAARDRLRQLVARGVEIERTGKKDRYGRTLAWLLLPDGREAGAVLKREKLAQPYHGKRGSWCGYRDR